MWGKVNWDLQDCSQQIYGKVYFIFMNNHEDLPVFCK